MLLNLLIVFASTWAFGFVPWVAAGIWFKSRFVVLLKLRDQELWQKLGRPALFGPIYSLPRAGMYAPWARFFREKQFERIRDEELRAFCRKYYKLNLMFRVYFVVGMVVMFALSLLAGFNLNT